MRTVAALAMVALGACAGAPATGPRPASQPRALGSERADGTTLSTRPRLEIWLVRTSYDIEGRSAAELKRAFRGWKGDGSWGGNYAGGTRWYVTWAYPYEQSADGCRTGPVSVVARIERTMPRWRLPAPVDAGLVDRWRRFLRNLERHEDVHQANGERAATEAQRQLEALPAQADCDALEALADRVGKRILQEHRARDVLHDFETDHGAAEGAEL